MVFMKGCINHAPFESGTADAKEDTELMAGLEDLLEIVSGRENEKCVTTSQTAARKCEDRHKQKHLDMLLLESYSYRQGADQEL